MRVTVEMGEDVMMDSDDNKLSISNVHMGTLEKIGGSGECFALEVFGYGIQIP